MGIGGVCFPKLGAHPLLFHAELEPEHDEDKDENDKSAHLGEGDRDQEGEGAQDARGDGFQTLGRSRIDGLICQ